MMGFIDLMRADGHTVESIIRVLQSQGVKIAARTYRAWKNHEAASRTITDAQVQDAVREAAWETVVAPTGVPRRKLRPEGLYGRRKMTAFIRRTAIATASRGAVDRAMRALGLVGVSRAKTIRTTIQAKDGIRAGDLLNRDFTAPRPNHTWVADFTYVRAWSGWVYVAFIVDVYAQRLLAWHASTTKHTDLVTTPLRMALWERDRQGHGVHSCEPTPTRAPSTRQLLTPTSSPGKGSPRPSGASGTPPTTR
jgi:transposase InsO family protein